MKAASIDGHYAPAALNLREAAPAKINLFLHVTGKRADGYHLLDSLVVFAACGDLLTVAPSDALTLTLDGPFGAALAGEGDNLVLRAARGLAEASGVAAEGALRLTNNLPVASGIGGGSADAAAALRLLSRHWHVAPASAALAVRLGADVPVCLAGRPARMQGIGEVLLDAPALPDFGLVLVNPGEAVATPDVFRARTGGFRPAADLPGSWGDAAALATTLSRCANDLEAPAVSLAPVVGRVLEALRAMPGVLLARMSGSGATCFALLGSAAAAEAAAKTLDRPGWWTWGGGVAVPALAT